jgi:hypothetical protein
MTEWKEVKLGDFFKVKYGFAFKGKNITSEETLDIFCFILIFLIARSEALLSGGTLCR